MDKDKNAQLIYEALCNREKQGHTSHTEGENRVYGILKETPSSLTFIGEILSPGKATTTFSLTMKE